MLLEGIFFVLFLYKKLLPEIQRNENLVELMAGMTYTPFTTGSTQALHCFFSLKTILNCLGSKLIFLKPCLKFCHSFENETVGKKQENPCCVQGFLEGWEPTPLLETHLEKAS